MNIINRLFYAFVILHLLVQNVSAGSIWTAKLPGDATWHSLTGIGTLLVGTKSSLVSLDADNGQVLWQRDDMPKTSGASVKEIVGTPVLIVNDFTGSIKVKSSMRAIDITTGKDLWETEKHFGQAVGVYVAPTHELAVFFENGPEEASGTGEHGMWARAFHIYTGEKKWQTLYDNGGDVPLHPADNAGKFFVWMDLSGHQEPLIEGDFMYVPFKGVTCLNLNSGVIQWEVPFKPSYKSYKKSYAPLQIEGDVIYAAGNGEVRAIDKNTGALKWKSEKIRSALLAEVTIAGDLVFARLGGQFFESGARQWKLDEPLGVVALDKATGAEKWRYSNIKDGITNLLVLPDLQTVMLAGSQTLVGLDFTSVGKTKETFKVPLEFKRRMGGAEVAAAGLKVGGGLLTGGLLGAAKGAVSAAGGGKQRIDMPVALVRLDNGRVAVRGQQHVASFDPVSRAVDWSVYFSAPGTNNFSLVAMGAVVAFTQVAYTGMAMTSTSYTQAGQYQKSAFADTERFQKMASKRFSAAQSSRRHVFMLTTVEEGKKSGPGLIKLDMATGEAAGQILLDDKEPEYLVDDVTSRVYYFDEKSGITAYQL